MPDLSQPDRTAARRSAFTLVETALLACVLGALLAVGVPTFLRTVQTSKVAEASTQLQELYRGTASYYAIARALPDHANAFCLPQSAGPTPATISARATATDWAAPATPGSGTWKALGFLPTEPLRYRYSYLPSQSGCALEPASTTITLRAEGDLDGDGVLSNFERTAAIKGAGELSPEPVLHIHDRIE